MPQTVTVNREPLILESGQDDTYEGLLLEAMQIALLDHTVVQFTFDDVTTVVTEEDSRKMLMPLRIRKEIADCEKQMGVLRQALERARKSRDTWMDVGLSSWPGEKF